MQNFTTQEHQRNHSTVMENPGKTIANLREKQRNRNLINGVIISAMALAVVATGTVLGSTVAHNQQLKGQLGDLTTQNQTLNQQLTELSTVHETPTVDTIDTAAYFNRPTTTIIDRADIAPTFTDNNQNDTTEPDNQYAISDLMLREGEGLIKVAAKPVPATDTTTEPSERPLRHRHHTAPFDADEATPLPRVPSGHQIRVR